MQITGRAERANRTPSSRSRRHSVGKHCRPRLEA
jgi:hypothetical protein